MHRATPYGTSFRAYVGGGARSVVHEVDDSKEMQEGKGNFLKGETSQGIESPQNYGFTSVTMDADKDSNGNITGSPETFVSFIGGNRSFPVNGNIDDRRHRLKNLDKGDVAMFRTKDDQQQFHLTTDGGFWSAPTDKTVRMQLVTKQQQQSQGGSSGQQGQQGQQSQSQHGQQAVRKNSTNSYVDLTQNATNVSGPNTYLRLADGKGYVHCSDDAKVWIGAEKNKAPFARLLTEDGPCAISYGALSPPSGVAISDDVIELLKEVAPADFPDPVPPARCFYTETTWFDAHTLADAWADFSGAPQSPAPYYIPFKFLRSDTASQAPAASVLGPGMLGLNGADGHLFWRDSGGAVQAAALTSIASIPGLLALHSIVRVDVIGPGSLTYNLDPRTKTVIAFLYGGSGGVSTIYGGGTPATAGGDTSIAGLATAYGGQGTGFDLNNNPTFGQHGSGSYGLVLVGGGPASERMADGLSGGNGGLVIVTGDVSGWGTLDITVGGGGTGDTLSGESGGVFLIEIN